MNKAGELLRQSANVLWNLGHNDTSRLTPREIKVIREVQEAIDEYMKDGVVCE